MAGGWYSVGLRLTQQDVAALAGVTRETAAVELSRLKRKGIVRYGSFHYEVHLPSLVAENGASEFDTLELK
jgi:CRP-like cAMP-binding protein